MSIPLQPKQVSSAILTNDTSKAAPGAPYTGLGERIVNVADPVASGDVVTLGSLLAGLASRREHSVNGARVDEVRNPTGFILRTSANNNVAGSFTGGGIGNKAIAGHFLGAPLLLSALVSIEWIQDVLVPEATGAVIRPFANLIVELDPAGAPGVYSIFVLGDVSSALNLGTYTVLGPTRTQVQWTAAANFVNVVVDKGMVIFPNPPGPVLVPVAQGPIQSVPNAWPAHAYRISDILAVYPNARIVDANPADGGMPANTIVSGLTLILGDSNNKVQNAMQITAWKLNGAAI